MIHDAPNIENTLSFSYERHPVEDLEPEESHDPSETVEALRAILRRIFEFGRHRRHEDLRSRLDTGFRRFVAMCYVIDDRLVANGKTQTQIAEALGITRAGLSKLCIEWSDRLGGLKAGGMKSASARASYAAVQAGHVGYRGRKKLSLGIGDPKQDKILARARDLRIRNALIDFITGKEWDKGEWHLLREDGLIDDDGAFTEQGRQRLEEERKRSNREEATLPPGRRGPGNAD